MLVKWPTTCLIVVSSVLLAKCQMTSFSREACDKDYVRGSCYCKLKDGLGTIDLRHLAKKTANEPLISRTGYYTYYLVLCGTLTDSFFKPCNNVASLCQTQTRPLRQSQSVGDPKTTRFEWRMYDNNTEHKLALVMEDRKTYTRSLIFLMCDPSQRETKLATNTGYQAKHEDKYFILKNELRGASVCPNAHELFFDDDSNDDSGSIGTFSLLLILVLAGFALYFVGGSIIMTYVYKHVGVQRIPNYSFWHDVVLQKIKGCLAAAGIRSDNTEAQQYQQFNNAPAQESGQPNNSYDYYGGGYNQ